MEEASGAAWALAGPVLFTALALLLAALWLMRRAWPGPGDHPTAAPTAPTAGEDEPRAADGREPAEEPGAGGGPAGGRRETPAQRDEEEEEEEAAATTTTVEAPGPAPEEKEPGPAEDGEAEEPEEEDEEEEAEAEGKEEDQESETEKLVVREPESENVDEQFSFKYSPGKLRGNQYQTLLTKEELEEEQRIQRQQLSAIFSLMKEKPETFGEMSETDIKEQLKLYDM